MEKQSEQNGSDILLLWISVAALAGDSGRGGSQPVDCAAVILGGGRPERPEKLLNKCVSLVRSGSGGGGGFA